MSWDKEYYATVKSYQQIGKKKNQVYDQILALQKNPHRSEEENQKLNSLWLEYNELAEQHVWAARCIDEMEGNY